jgi:hypothetical protein
MQVRRSAHLSFMEISAIFGDRRRNSPEIHAARRLLYSLTPETMYRRRLANR